MSKVPPRILLVEDHQDIASLVVDYFEEKGAQTDYAADSVTGLHLAVTHHYDVIILDLGLPGMDGIELCGRLRQDAASAVSILMLTARDTLADKLAGFDAGADDYLVKPFELAELGARVEALYRRNRPGGNEQHYRLENLTLDTDTRVVQRAGQVIDLKPISFTILETLIRASPRVVKRTDLERAVWGDEPPDSDALRTHIAALRQAVDKPFDKALIHTIHGVGYSLR